MSQSTAPAAAVQIASSRKEGVGGCTRKGRVRRTNGSPALHPRKKTTDREAAEKWTCAPLLLPATAAGACAAPVARMREAHASWRNRLRLQPRRPLEWHQGRVCCNVGSAEAHVYMGCVAVETLRGLRLQMKKATNENGCERSLSTLHFLPMRPPRVSWAEVVAPVAAVLVPVMASVKALEAWSTMGSTWSGRDAFALVDTFSTCSAAWALKASMFLGCRVVAEGDTV
eukprot:TRINITY_DN29186_c0_g1_i1.p1 TRINITY_DN29186_c0_g1~~TRINITY_DN29186_c0_g1_i1.p1  ORF type:complete len:228 (+),score=7.72 TRINITY_DN29186_c0_g1_i1:66-749(+)